MKKVLFIGLASSFTPGMTYQDNYLCEEMLEKGYQVTYISNPEKFINGKMTYVGYEDYVVKENFRLIRLKYQKLFSFSILKKIRWFRGLLKLIKQVDPDVIFCHNFQYWSIKDVIKYKKKCKNISVYVDVHSAFYNSGKNFISRFFLHKIIYRHLAKKIVPCANKIFYIGPEEKDFALKMYKIPENKLEFYPLGGKPFSDYEYENYREEKRNELGFDNSKIVLVHTGKLDKLKKTDILLEAFSNVESDRLRLLIIGSFSEEINGVLNDKIGKDDRIVYVGWKTGDELQKYLCASDVYCQPGGVSATLQNAICQRCAIMTYPHKIYTGIIDYGQFLYIEDAISIEKTLCGIISDEISVSEMKKCSKKCAFELLDYKILAERIKE